MVIISPDDLGTFVSDGPAKKGDVPTISQRIAVIVDNVTPPEDQGRTLVEEGKLFDEEGRTLRAVNQKRFLPHIHDPASANKVLGLCDMRYFTPHFQVPMLLGGCDVSSVIRLAQNAAPLVAAVDGVDRNANLHDLFAWLRTEPTINYEVMIVALGAQWEHPLDGTVVPCVLEIGQKRLIVWYPLHYLWTEGQYHQKKRVVFLVVCKK